MKCTWHLNVIVCFPASLPSLFLSFRLKQTGADAGNGLQALSEAEEMEKDLTCVALI